MILPIDVLMSLEIKGIGMREIAGIVEIEIGMIEIEDSTMIAMIALIVIGVPEAKEAKEKVRVKAKEDSTTTIAVMTAEEVSGGIEIIDGTGIIEETDGIQITVNPM